MFKVTSRFVFNYIKPLFKPRALRNLLAGAALLGIAMPAFADPLQLFPGGPQFPGDGFPFVPGVLEVSRVAYDGNTFGSSETYPFIFNDPNVTGVQGSIHVDQYLTLPGLPIINTFPLSGLTTSFSSKSEGALMLSTNGSFLTYMGYVGPIGAEGVSNSYTTGPGTNLQPPVLPAYDRAVALIGANGKVTVQNESNAYSGDNPRAAITVDGTQLYMAGNSDSTTYTTGCPAGETTCGPGLTIGARYGTPGSNTSIQLGNYVATDRNSGSNKESAKQHIKDNNFRGIGIFNGNLYVSKGSGGNGDDGLFQVQNGTGNGLPTGTGNTIVELFGSPATDSSGNPSPYTPFGFFFANATTLYVADEGLATDASGNLLPTPDPLAGLEKWSLVNGTWQLVYTLQNGLDLNHLETIEGYPVQSATTGLRNMTGVINPDGTVTIYAITGQFSSISGGEPDPTKLVVITDRIQATKPSYDEEFVTLKVSRPSEVFRGVAFVPCADAFNLYSDPNFVATSTCPFIHHD